MGKEIFVKSNDRIDDGMRSLEKRFENKFGKLSKEKKDEEIYRE